MKRLEIARWASHFPSMFPFGFARQPRLTKEEEQTALFDDRLKSVWAYVAMEVIKHNRRLNRRERIHLSVEDAMQGVVAALCERDGKWSPKRGRYITFAAVVMRHALTTMTERMRIVKLPANAMLDLRRYRELHAAGSLNERQTATMRSMEQVLAEAVTLTEPDVDSAAPDLAHVEEQAQQAKLARRHAIAVLRAAERPAAAYVLSRLHGIGREPAMSVKEVAASMPGKSSPRTVRLIEARAREQLAVQMKGLTDVNFA